MPTAVAYTSPVTAITLTIAALVLVFGATAMPAAQAASCGKHAITGRASGAGIEDVFIGADGRRCGTSEPPRASVAKACSRFIVGDANSTAYPGMKLPAHGTAAGSSCATLRRLARKVHQRFALPEAATSAPPGKYGPEFRLPDGDRTWPCRFKSIGGSGPSYDIRCRRGHARLHWVTGS